MHLPQQNQPLTNKRQTQQNNGEIAQRQQQQQQQLATNSLPQQSTAHQPSQTQQQSTNQANNNNAHQTFTQTVQNKFAKANSVKVISSITPKATVTTISSPIIVSSSMQQQQQQHLQHNAVSSINLAAGVHGPAQFANMGPTSSPTGNFTTRLQQKMAPTQVSSTNACMRQSQSNQGQSQNMAVVNSLAPVTVTINATGTSSLGRKQQHSCQQPQPSSSQFNNTAAGALTNKHAATQSAGGNCASAYRVTATQRPHLSSTLIQQYSSASLAVPLAITPTSPQVKRSGMQTQGQTFDVQKQHKMSASPDQLSQSLPMGQPQIRNHRTVQNQQHQLQLPQEMAMGGDFPTISFMRKRLAGGEIKAAISDEQSPNPGYSEVVSERCTNHKAQNGSGYFQTELIAESKSACRRGSGSQQHHFMMLPASSTFTAPILNSEKQQAQPHYQQQQSTGAIQYAGQALEAAADLSNNAAPPGTTNKNASADPQQDAPSGGEEQTPKRDNAVVASHEIGFFGQIAATATGTIPSLIQGQLLRHVSAASLYQQKGSGTNNPPNNTAQVQLASNNNTNPNHIGSGAIDSTSSVHQQRMFTRPKNRMLASTAPAARHNNNVINIHQTQAFLHPMPDQAHEQFHPIREGRQMSLLIIGSESSAGNTSFHNSQPMNDVTLQPTSKAFSTTGFRHVDEHLSSNYQAAGGIGAGGTVGEPNESENKAWGLGGGQGGGGGHSRQRIQRSSLSKQSHSAAGDTGLAMMLHDESMELLDEDEQVYNASSDNIQDVEEQLLDDHDELASAAEPNQTTFKHFSSDRRSQQLAQSSVMELDDDNNRGCLKVVNDQASRQHQSLQTAQKYQSQQQTLQMQPSKASDSLQILQMGSSNQKGGKGLPSPQLLPKSRARKDVPIMQTATRMRLHSNFTSIADRGHFNLQSRADLVADTNALQTDQTVFALDVGGSKTTQKFKLEPRNKRQAQSIINRRRSVRLNMQASNMKGGVDEPIGTSNIMIEDCWRDNQSTSNLFQFHQQIVEQQTDPAPSICESCHERIVSGTKNQTSGSAIMLINSRRDDVGDGVISQPPTRHHGHRQLELRSSKRIMRFGSKNGGQFGQRHHHLVGNVDDDDDDVDEVNQSSGVIEMMNDDDRSGRSLSDDRLHYATSSYSSSNRFGFKEPADELQCPCIVERRSTQQSAQSKTNDRRASNVVHDSSVDAKKNSSRHQPHSLVQEQIKMMKLNHSTITSKYKGQTGDMNNDDEAVFRVIKNYPNRNKILVSSKHRHHHRRSTSSQRDIGVVAHQQDDHHEKVESVMDSWPRKSDNFGRGHHRQQYYHHHRGRQHINGDDEEAESSNMINQRHRHRPSNSPSQSRQSRHNTARILQLKKHQEDKKYGQQNNCATSGNGAATGAIRGKTIAHNHHHSSKMMSYFSSTKQFRHHNNQNLKSTAAPDLKDASAKAAGMASPSCYRKEEEREEDGGADYEDEEEDLDEEELPSTGYRKGSGTMGTRVRAEYHHHYSRNHHDDSLKSGRSLNKAGGTERRLRSRSRMRLPSRQIPPSSTTTIRQAQPENECSKRANTKGTTEAYQKIMRQLQPMGSLDSKQHKRGGYSRSRSPRSKSPSIGMSRRQNTLPLNRNLNLQEKDSQSAVGSSHRSITTANNPKNRKHEASATYRRQYTMHHEVGGSSARRSAQKLLNPLSSSNASIQANTNKLQRGSTHQRDHHQSRDQQDCQHAKKDLRHGSNYSSSRRSKRHDDRHCQCSQHKTTFAGGKRHHHRDHQHHHHGHCYHSSTASYQQLHLNRRMTTHTFNNSRIHRHHGHTSSKRAVADEQQHQDMKDAFYQRRGTAGGKDHQYYHHRQHSRSRGRGSFKTQKYHQRRRSRSRNLSSLSSRGGRSIMSSYSRGPPISSFRHSKKFPSQHSSESPVNQPATTAQVDRSKDAGHFEWRKNMTLENCEPISGSGVVTGSVAHLKPKGEELGAMVANDEENKEPQVERTSSKYQVVEHLGDGTFGRALKCVEISQSSVAVKVTKNASKDANQTTLTDQQQQFEKATFAIKVVRAVPRYAESAKFEAQILQDLQKQGGCEKGIVYLKETFMNKSRQSHGENVSNMCLVFEPLGKSLYDFIKDNGYKGFEIGQIREIAIQALNAIEFLHSLKLTHTDLKPENILLKSDSKETITDESLFPIQVQNKRSIYGSQKCSEVDDSSYFSGKSAFAGCGGQVGKKWCKPTSCEIKVIDFGGATYEHERHTLIINTRQYRAPEVILENLTWNEKTDIWSMACILVELYTGELFFDTDENVEHLAMIEKQCGTIPLSMAQRCGNEQIKRQLHREGTAEEEQYVRNKKMRLRWPAASLRASSRQAVSSMLLLDDIINDKWGEQHRMFKDLLKFMLKIDPRERPSATECLNHYFFNDIRKLSKSTEKTQVSTADHQFESPRHKHQ